MSKQRHSQRIHQADLHTCAVQAWLSSRSPTAQCWDGIGVKVQSTGLQIPLLNLALSKGYPIGTPQQTILDEIEQVKAFFAGRNMPWYWWLGPNHHPRHLPSLLQGCGIVSDDPVLPAMAASLPLLDLEKGSPGIKVWLAESHFDLEAASKIRHTAFRFPEGVGTDYFEAMADDWLAGNPARLYLAGVNNGPPAAIGALIMGAGIPGVYVMATLPEWRRCGLGRAIITRILRQAGEDGHDLIVLTASRVGYMLYRQFGFEHVFDYQIYQVKNAGS